MGLRDMQLAASARARARNYRHHSAGVRALLLTTGGGRVAVAVAGAHGPRFAADPQGRAAAAAQAPRAGGASSSRTTTRSRGASPRSRSPS